MTALWVMRMGAQGEREDAALSDGKLYYKFPQLPDLRDFASQNELTKHLLEIEPAWSRRKAASHASQLQRFTVAMAKGDLVIMPRKFTDVMSIGEIVGDYVHDPEGVSSHTRAVRWLKEDVPRIAFKSDLRTAINVPKTLFSPNVKEAVSRVQSVLDAQKDMGPSVGTAVSPRPDDETSRDRPDPATEIPTAFEEDVLPIELVAQEQIETLIRSEFKGHDLTYLVAELLEAEGYTCKVSPPGPDGGVDILAAGGAIGLGDDRICVEVKSTAQPVNHDVVLRLSGAVRHTNARTGLLVSLAGVNGPAKREMENRFFELRLWQMEDVREAVCRSYAELSDETRAKLPLKQVWAPIVETEL